MCPLRPTAIATPGATASSIAVFTILSSFAGIVVSSPELFNPSRGSRYLIGADTTALRAAGGGGAQAAPAIIDTRAIERRDFMSQGGGTRSTRRRANSPAWGS